MIARIGNVKFPLYECVRTLDVFTSAVAYEAYEAARNFEKSVESAILYKNWPRGLEFGAVVELEVTEFTES